MPGPKYQLTASGMSSRRGYRFPMSVIVGCILEIHDLRTLRVCLISSRSSSLFEHVGRLSRNIASASAVISSSGSTSVLQHNGIGLPKSRIVPLCLQSVWENAIMLLQFFQVNMSKFVSSHTSVIY